MGLVNVGLIGYKFMGKAHSNAYKSVGMFFPLENRVVMKAICGRDREGVKKAAEAWGWESFETDWKKLIKRKDIDVVDISTPGNLHAEMAIAAARAGKHVICEKPLANSLAEARDMLKSVQKAGVKNMVFFNYRRVPAVAFARQMIREGKLGDIYHFRAAYLQDWIVDAEFPLVWRLDKKIAGSGALGDIGAHIIDLGLFLLGEISEVVADLKTFIKKRPLLESGSAFFAQKKAGPPELGTVTVDDAALFIARFKNGAMGSFEATRFATGRKNANQFEIYGSKGALSFNLESLNELHYYSKADSATEQGFKKVLVTDAGHPYLNAWWPPGHIIGYEHTFTNAMSDFFRALETGQPVTPDFGEGVQVQAVLDAVEKSAERRKWMKVEA
jgi:predicted dehydrogenase